MNSQIEVKEAVLPQVTIFSTRFITNVETIAQDMGGAFTKLFNESNAKNMTITAPPFSLYHCLEWNPQHIDLEVCLPIQAGLTGEQIRVLESTTVLTTIHKGEYQKLEATYNLFYAWLEANGKKQNGLSRETYLNSPCDTAPENLLTELAVSI